MTNQTKNTSLKVKNWPREIKMQTISEKSVPQMKEKMQSDQLAVAEVLVSDRLECQSVVLDKSDDEKDDDGEIGWSSEDEGVSEMSSENKELWESFLNYSGPYNPLHFSCPTEDKMKASDNHHDDEEEEEDDGETGWSLEDEGVSEMSSENKELWESFLNYSGPYNPLHFSCPTEAKMKASDDDDDYEEESVSPQKKDETEWSEEEESDWSDEDLKMSAENRELWESFVNKSDRFDPLCFSCSTVVKVKASENHTASSPIASDVKDNPEQNTKERETKVRFSEVVTIHYIEQDAASQAARDGSCWMEMARDRDRFKRRVEQIGEIISPCLTAQHRARVLNRLSNHSDKVLTVQLWQTTKKQKTTKRMEATAVKIMVYHVFTSRH